MGSEATLSVLGGRDASHRTLLLERGVQLLADLESRWSRFRTTSDVGRINAGDGCAVTVHWTTRDVILLAIEGWKRTDGRFDPTIGAMLSAHGYDRNYLDARAAMEEGGLSMKQQVGPSSSGCGDIVVDEKTSRVSVPEGMQLDFGGIGKGFAADLIVGELMNDGAAGVLVNVGGDVRLSGEPPTDDGWLVRVDSYLPADSGPLMDKEPLTILRLIDGAVCVSSTRSRSWVTADLEFHHIMDPRTGQSSKSGLEAAVVIAGTAWWAEVLTKALLAGPDIGLDATFGEMAAGAHACTVSLSGVISMSAEFSSFAVRPMELLSCS